MKSLAAENARIKRMYVEVRMQNDLLKDALKKVTRACDHKELAKQASIRLACATFGISETCYRYERRLSEENEEIAAWLHYSTWKHKRWGVALCFFHLRNVWVFGWNHKRVYRIYKREGMHLRVKPRYRVKRAKPDKLSVPGCPKQNAYVERFNRTVRQEYLEMNDFATLGDAQHLSKFICL